MTDMPSLRTPAAQYLRMSTDNQRYSLENQAALIERYAADRNFEIVRSYEDSGRSGVTTVKREGLKALLHDVVTGQTAYRTILVVDVSRWGRFQDPDEAAHYEFLCREAGVRVEYCAEAFDNDGSMSASVLKHLKRVMAAEYSRQLSDRCTAGKRRQVLAGNAAGGAPPYGLRRQSFNGDGSPGPVLQTGERRTRLDQTVRLVRGPDEEARTTRLIFKLFVNDGLGVTAVARMLNTRGLTFTGGIPWKYQHVKAVLKNESCLGYTVFNKVCGQFANPAPAKPPSDWKRVKILEPIISQALFLAAQQKLAILKGHSTTRDEMLDKLRALLKREGRLSSSIVNRSEALPGRNAYKERFGSIQSAYEQIGYVPSRRFRMMSEDSDYDRDVILGRLRVLHQERGFLSLKLIAATPGLPSASFLAKEFGGAVEAYRAAGIETTKSDLQRAGWARRRARLKLAFTDLVNAGSITGTGDCFPKPSEADAA